MGSYTPSPSARAKRRASGTARNRPAAAYHLVRAAIAAPSLHNSQPWLFTGDAPGVDLYADPAHRVPLADPAGRELVIGCGAALFNVRLAMRHLGFVPVVRFLPTPGNPAHLARVDWGPYGSPAANEERMHRSLRIRRTHRGPFSSTRLPEPLVDELREQTRAEGADLCILEPGRQRSRIAALVREAETFQRSDPAWRAELIHWTQEFTGSRLDGVPLASCTYHPDCVTLAGRDFVGLTTSLPQTPEVWPARTGIVAVLTTWRDSRLEWLQAGQSLQRMLLYATAHGVSAALHTQPLELPRLRAEVSAALSLVARPGSPADRPPRPRDVRRADTPASG
ncbi:hypothetical protein GTY65_27415 [Streptomyces sp. SID8379]|uniref:Acg family FMN-binding oxidoreductase n=1 Tax=unclassified Streptomyces TaxID=2593676 RepID=UPI0003A5182D|nr:MULTISPECIES: hypothetical protein [unclassified Streptomyces]MYW67774.1 hypothetical protein [Streptomyces sp. SID8379]